ncbi:MAG: phosphoribosyltransferase [Chloroflexi bacterium]|nr:phosphoribosyltransferase [Chloroflexota bacterium]
MIFRDRREAGHCLAERLFFLRDQRHLIVLGIPRGGVVVAAEIARALGAPLDVVIAHKIGAPFNPELAIGALASDGPVLLDTELMNQLHLNERDIAKEIEAERAEIARRLEHFRPHRPPLDVKNKAVVVVDDGVATGSTMLAALRALREHKPAMVILAIPVGPPEVVEMLTHECDRAVVLDTPDPFWAVGRFYRRFEQTEDETVVKLLEEGETSRSGDLVTE